MLYSLGGKKPDARACLENREKGCSPAVLTRQGVCGEESIVFLYFCIEFALSLQAASGDTFFSPAEWSIPVQCGAKLPLLAWSWKAIQDLLAVAAARIGPKRQRAYVVYVRTYVYGEVQHSLLLLIRYF